jgi:hypothetical protein
MVRLLDAESALDHVLEFRTIERYSGIHFRITAFLAFELVVKAVEDVAGPMEL